MSASPTATHAVGETAEPRSWGGFARLLVATAAGLFVALVGVLLLVDPYDTGRTGVIGSRGLGEQYPFTANASRARDPRFDAAIFGNSHVQELRPERLDALTGLSFVTLMMPATWPRDQLEVLRWFVANRRTPPGAVVLGLDHFWCFATALNSGRFPTWLYAESFPAYLGGLVRYRSFEASAARLRYWRSGKGGYRPDGFWDYGPIYDKLGLGEQEASRRKLATRKPNTVNLGGSFPAIDLLRQALAGLPPEAAVVLVRPPVYRTAMPEPGPEEQTEQACRSAMRTTAASRPRTTLLDYYGQYVDDPDAFYDHDHYRDAVAVRIERDIAAALKGL